MTLEAEGFEVETFNDGQSALDAFNRRMPDMAVLDIKMPRMDGMDLLQRLRQKSTLPVIFLTSKDDEIDEGDNNVGGHSHRPADPVAVEMVPPRFKSLDVSSHDADADDDSRRSIFDVGFSELKETVQSAGQLLTHRLQSELESKV